jgi:hypothetical protein
MTQETSTSLGPCYPIFPLLHPHLSLVHVPSWYVVLGAWVPLLLSLAAVSFLAIPLANLVPVLICFVVVYLLVVVHTEAIGGVVARIVIVVSRLN